MSLSPLALAERLLHPVTRAAEEAAWRLGVTFDGDRTEEVVFGAEVPEAAMYARAATAGELHPGAGDSLHVPPARGHFIAANAAPNTARSLSPVVAGPRLIAGDSRPPTISPSATSHDASSQAAIAPPIRGQHPDRIVTGKRPAATVPNPVTSAPIAAASELAAAGLPVGVVNPRQLGDFARATGPLAKTDASDARVLAHLAEPIQPQTRSLPDAPTVMHSVAPEDASRLVPVPMPGSSEPIIPAGQQVAPPRQDRVSPSGTAPPLPSNAATPAEPSEPFAGLLPIRPYAPQAPADAREPAPTTTPTLPSTGARPGAWPPLARLSQAMQTVLGRAADLTDAALGQAESDDTLDRDDPDMAALEGATTTSPATQVSNTFNVNVAIGERVSATGYEALRDALIAILRDSARRQGLDV